MGSRKYSTPVDVFAFGVLLGLVVHPSCCSNAVADILWTTALYVETVAMVPQLFLLTKLGGEVDSLQGHYIACIRKRGRCLWGADDSNVWRLKREELDLENPQNYLALYQASESFDSTSTSPLSTSTTATSSAGEGAPGMNEVI